MKYQFLLLISIFLFIGNSGYAQTQNNKIHHVSNINSAIPHGEPYIAVNPKNSSEMIVVAMSTKEIQRNNPFSYDVSLFFTSNKGVKWEKIKYPSVKNEFAKGDPWVVWGKDGIIYFSCMIFTKDEENKRGLKVFLFTSKDKGKSWSQPKEVFKNNKGLDHPIVTNNHKSKNPISLFVAGGHGIASTQITTLNRNLVTVNTFKHGYGNVPNNNLGSGVQLDNSSLIFTQTTGMSELRSVSTSDLGKTFKVVTITKNCIPYGFPMLTLDKSGKKRNNRLYAVWSERGDVGTQIFMSYSDNAGHLWSKKRQISKPVEKINLMPQVKVNNDGDLLIAWTSSESDQQLDCININYAISTDGGNSFTQKALFDKKHCSKTSKNGAVVQKWQLGGDYFGVDSDADGNFHLAWADSRTGVYQIWHRKVSK